MSRTGVPLVEPILPPSRRGRWWVAGLLAVAALTRVGLVLAIMSRYHPQTDALQFDTLATSLAHGHGFGQATLPPMIGPTALRAPLYPLLLAATYLVFGVHSYTAALMVNAVLGIAVVALVGVVGTQLLGRRAGGTAMGLAAAYPAMLLTGSSLQLEPLLTALCLAALAAALQHRRAPCGLLWPLVAGACTGLGVLTREQAFFFLPVIAWLLWTADRPRPTWRDTVGRRSAATAAVVAVLVVLPWTIRNEVQLHAFVPVTTSAGFGLVGTYNETSEAHRARWIPPYNDPRAAQVLLALKDPTEVRVDAAMRRLSLQIVRESPTYPVRVAFWNFVRGFDLDGGAYTRLIAPYLPYPPNLLGPAIWSGWLLLALAALGAATLRIRGALRSVWAIPAGLTAFMIVFLPFSIRYRALLEPFTLFLAAAAVLAVYEGWGGSGSGPEDAEAPAPALAPAPRRTRQLVAADRDPQRGPAVVAGPVRPSRPR